MLRKKMMILMTVLAARGTGTPEEVTRRAETFAGGDVTVEGREPQPEKVLNLMRSSRLSASIVLLGKTHWL